MQYSQNTGWLLILVLPQQNKQLHMYTEYCKEYKVRIWNNKTVLTNYWWLSFFSADRNVFFVVVFLTQSGRWLYREAPWNSKDERYIFVLANTKVKRCIEREAAKLQKVLPPTTESTYSLYMWWPRTQLCSWKSSMTSTSVFALQLNHVQTSAVRNTMT